MSQQGPGGYGGGGPYGPPGGGGYGGPPPGGGYPPPGGAPPGGYGPPGGPPGYGGPPQGGPPPGYGPPQQGYGGYPGAPPGGPGGPLAPPPKKSKALLFVGLGCGALILLGIAGSVASYFYMKSKVSDAEQAIANYGTGGAGVLAAPAAGSVSATCAKAIACCKAITEKSAGTNTALVDQACNGIGLLADTQCLQQYNALKTSAAAVHATCD